MRHFIEIPPQINESQAWNHGKRWTPEEEAQLRNLFSSKMPIHLICYRLGRQPTGVLPRLHSLGLIESDGQNYMYRNPSAHSTQPENTAMTTTKLIESKTLILGREAEAMSDSEIFKLIAKTENELASLKAIRTPSKKLEAHVAKTEAELKRLAEYVDSREGA